MSSTTSEEMYTFDGGSAFYITSFTILLFVTIVLSVIIFIIWRDLRRKQKDAMVRQSLEQ